MMVWYILKFKFGVFDGGLEAVPGLRADWWFGISPEGFGTVAMLVNVSVALAVMRWTAPPPTAVQALVEDIRIPSSAAPSDTPH